MGPLPAVAGCDCHICRPEAAYAHQERRTIDTVLEHGWQVLFVSDDVACGNPDHHEHGGHEHVDPGVDFAYTVGLGHRCGHPELLMSGLDQRLMHRALNDVAQRVLDGRRLAPGDVLEGVLAGVPVVAEPVADAALGDTVTWSGWFHRTKPEAVVIVWPSTSGLFAWEPGAPDVLDERQPRSWREPTQHAAGLGGDESAWAFPVPPDRLTFSCTHVVDAGEAVLWAAREADHERGEDWSVHCGADEHDTADMRLVHLAHLVRAAPSLRELSELRVGEQASRADVDSRWVKDRLT